LPNAAGAPRLELRAQLHQRFFVGRVGDQPGRAARDPRRRFERQVDRLDRVDLLGLRHHVVRVVERRRSDAHARLEVDEVAVALRRGLAERGRDIVHVDLGDLVGDEVRLRRARDLELRHLPVHLLGDRVEDVVGDRLAAGAVRRRRCRLGVQCRSKRQRAGGDE
jgi:hypothetical protein